MKKKLLTLAFVLSCFLPIWAQNASNLNTEKDMNRLLDDTKDNIVRLSKITVDPAQLDAYNAFLKEEIETSMRLESGVLMLYAISEKAHPNKVTILEIYANREAYESHIRTPHFQKYKQGTLKMVRELELVDSNPLIPGLIKGSW